MNILVTGGAGYIGSHVCKALSQAGFTPVVYDNMSQGYDWAVQWGPLVVGDILDAAALKAAFAAFQPEAVIHLASYINVRESQENPGKYYRNNVLGTLTLLEAMVKSGVLRLVFSSSAAVYGLPQTTPLSESHPKAPINTYGKTKWMCEQMIEDFSDAHGLLAVNLRYFNAAGADPEGELGEEHRVETHLLPLTIFTALQKRPLLSIYGTDHPTPDGTAIRDYIHVSDLADAHVQALAWLNKYHRTGAFNLGKGSGHSVKQIISAVEAHGNRAVATEICPRFATDPPILVASAAQAEQHLGWTPRRSDLATIVETAWRWHSR